MFQAGQRSAQFEISIFDNQNDNPNKTVTLHLGNPTGGALLGIASNAVLRIVDDDVNVLGTYKISGTYARSGCPNNSLNHAVSFTGEANFDYQEGNAFSGSFAFVFPLERGAMVLSMSGRVGPSGGMTGSFSGNGESGTFTGSLNAGKLQVTFTGYSQSTGCHYNGSAWGSRYNPSTVGFAPGRIGGGTVFVNITSGTGIYFSRGQLRMELGPDYEYWMYYLPFEYLLQDGLYLYTKTGPNTAVLLTCYPNNYITSYTTLNFTSATGGTFDVEAVSASGTQHGTFRFDL
jgi:hypothetical protein